MPHQQTPDRDNLLKAFQDALLQSDAHIYDGRVAKFWTNGPGYIVVEASRFTKGRDEKNSSN